MHLIHANLVKLVPHIFLKCKHLAVSRFLTRIALLVHSLRAISLLVVLCLIFLTSCGRFGFTYNLCWGVVIDKRLSACVLEVGHLLIGI